MQEAITMLEQVRNIREKIMVEDHLDRLTLQHGLAAAAYLANEQVQEAVIILEQVVKIKKKTNARKQLSSCSTWLRLRKEIQSMTLVAEFQKSVYMRRLAGRRLSEVEKHIQDIAGGQLLIL